MTAPVLSQHHNIFRTPRGVARSHDQADLGPSYLARDGCTPSGDDSLQHSDAGVSMGGLSGGHGGPEDAMACEKTSNAMVMIQISPRAEITGSRSPSDLSVRLVGKVRPPNKQQSLTAQFGCGLSQREQRAQKARNHAELGAAQERRAAMRHATR